MVACLSVRTHAGRHTQFVADDVSTRSHNSYTQKHLVSYSVYNIPDDNVP